MDLHQDLKREHSFSSSSHPSSVRLSQSERFSTNDIYNLLNVTGNDHNNNNNNNNSNGNNMRKIARSYSAGNERTYADVYGNDPLFNEYVSQLSGQSAGANRVHEGPNGGHFQTDPLTLSPGYRLHSNQFEENKNLNNNHVNHTRSLFQDNLHVEVEVEVGTDSPVGVTDASVESGEDEEDVASIRPTPLVLISSNVSTENKKKRSKKKNSLNIQK